LGPVKVEYQGKVYQTQPIEVKVVEGRLGKHGKEGKKERKPRHRPPVPGLEGGVVL
jgi:hypothetical protein